MFLLCLIGVCIDTYVIYQGFLEKLTDWSYVSRNLSIGISNLVSQDTYLESCILRYVSQILYLEIHISNVVS